jgi:hypothetical protein
MQLNRHQQLVQKCNAPAQQGDVHAAAFSGDGFGKYQVIAMAMRRRWPVFSGAAHAIGSLPWFKKWLNGKQSVIDSAEKNLFSFCYDTPPSGEA